MHYEIIVVMVEVVVQELCTSFKNALFRDQR